MKSYFCKLWLIDMSRRVGLRLSRFNKLCVLFPVLPTSTVCLALHSLDSAGRLSPKPNFVIS